jgi:hypothetical protein
MNRFKTLLAAGAVGLATLGLTGLTPLPAKASSTFTSRWFSMGTGECLGVYAANMTDGTAIVQAPCDGTPNQTWITTSYEPNGAPGGSFTLMQNSQDPSKCLGVYGAATNDGANLVIWDCLTGHADQSWYFYQVVQGTRGNPWGCFTIENGNAIPKVIGILGGNSAPPLTQAVLWDNLTPSHTDQIFCPA